MKAITIIVALVVVLVVSADRGKPKQHHWDYRRHGPSTWAKTYPTCRGSKQSPINIVTCETDDASFGDRIVAHNYHKKPVSTAFKMKNNGHTLQMDLPPNTTYYVRKGIARYIPLQVHIHFDPITGKGSEHMLNSRKYFAEIHIVHKNAKYLGKTFMKKSDGLLVIGLFVELDKGAGDDDDEEYNLDYNFAKSITTWEKYTDRGTSFAMGLMAYAATKLKTPGNDINIPAFPLGWLLPVQSRRNAHIGYVTYKGSLTTPPCSEIVDWVVITGKVLKMSEKLAGNLKAVSDSSKKPMAGNNRPIQDLNDREVSGVNGSI